MKEAAAMLTDHGMMAVFFELAHYAANPEKLVGRDLAGTTIAALARIFSRLKAPRYTFGRSRTLLLTVTRRALR
jgi:hypothetical protein